MAKASMTAEEFDVVRERLVKMTPDNAAAARKVLVDGIPPVEVAQQCNMSKQRLNGILNSVRAAANGVPVSWVRVEVWVPPELVQQVRDIEERAKAKLGGTPQ